MPERSTQVEATGHPRPARAAAGFAAAIFALALPRAEAEAERLQLGPWEVGGALRVNLFERSWIDARDQRDHWAFDTAIFDLGFRRGDWDASAQYRYYYVRDDTDYHFLHHAWIGYQISPEQRVQAGVQQVPFGLLPYASHNYFFSINYYVGLEDNYGLGAVWRERRDRWTIHAGYFPRDGGSYFGSSRDSARYSYDVVRTPDSANSERHQLNLRIAYLLGEGTRTAEIGTSLQYGRIPNRSTGRSGDHFAGALHFDGRHGPWGLKAQVAHYRYRLENPPGTDRREVMMGAYDAPYRVAARGFIYTFGVSRRWHIESAVIDAVTLYNDYSFLHKTEAGFNNSHQNVLGAGLDFAGPFYVFVDYALGRHHAWLGRDYGTAFGRGASQGGWEHRFNVNIGVYF